MSLRALLGTCKGRSFAAYWDTAIIRLFVDTGRRLAEMTGLAVDDLDTDTRLPWCSGRANGRVHAHLERRLVRRTATYACVAVTFHIAAG
jgi:integrase